MKTDKEFRTSVRKAVIEDWDDREITKLILESENDIQRLKIIKTKLEKVLKKDPDADLAAFFICDIRKMIDNVLYDPLAD